jgi:hypothetical protein
MPHALCLCSMPYDQDSWTHSVESAKFSSVYFSSTPGRDFTVGDQPDHLRLGILNPYLQPIYWSRCSNALVSRAFIAGITTPGPAGPGSTLPWYPRGCKSHVGKMPTVFACERQSPRAIGKPRSSPFSRSGCLYLRQTGLTILFIES